MLLSDYAKFYRDKVASGESKDNALWDLQRLFLDEATIIMSKKRIRNDLTLIGILKEQDQKWRSLSKLVHDIPPSGFVLGIFEVIPEIYNAAEVRGFLDLLKKPCT